MQKARECEPAHQLLLLSLQLTGPDWGGTDDDDGVQ